MLDLIIYLDASRFRGMVGINRLENEDDAYQPAVPVEWIRQIFHYRAIKTKSKILVYIHVYYLELLPEIIELLKNISEDFDLIITNSSQSEVKIDSLELPNTCQKKFVLKSSNRGRDIGPLIGLVNSGLLEDYQLILKVHTKKSEWRNGHDFFEDSGSEWREAFLRDLLGSPEGVKMIVNSFRSDSNLGLVTANNQILDSNFVGKNYEKTVLLAKSLYIEQYVEDLAFPAGSMYWCRPIVLSSLSPLNLNLNHFEIENGQNDGTLAHAIERLIGLIIVAYGFKQLEIDEIQKLVPAPVRKTRMVAYYLPQFYPFPENDLEWGTGFTEWSNVARSRPQFEGHIQPVLPEGLGFYDLRIEQNVLNQERLAQSNGISSFCYYYYNFGNRELMSDLIHKRLKREGGLSFNILWVNESWSRAWDGSDNLITQKQTYPDGWETEFFFSILPFLKHADYTTTDKGFPILGIYRPLDIPELEKALNTWRALAFENGLPGLFIVGVRAPKNFGGASLDFNKYGLDATQDFAPHGIEWVRDFELADSREFKGQIFSIRKTLAEYGAGMGVNHGVDQFPGVMVGFDNTPRRGSHAYLISDSNPFVFRRWMLHSIEVAIKTNPANPFIFINAWNEWAETSMLEPNSKWKSLYLQVIKQLNS